MTRPTIRLLALLLILRVGHATTPALLQAQTIWVEGEKPARSTMSRHPWWYDQVKKNLLSGSDWISNWSDDKDGVAEYVIEVPVTGHYALWIRANPVGTRLAYLIGSGKWTPIDMTEGAIDTINVAADDKPDLRFLAWKKAGEIALTRGRHTISFRMSSENHHHGALDAFVFTTKPFLPSGTMRPGEAKGVLQPARHLALPARTRHLQP